jgi:transcriptional regulator
VSDAPADSIAGRMKAIVGVALQIYRLEGKWKMSQNRPDADIAGVILGLGASQASGDQAVGEIVSERRPAV